MRQNCRHKFHSKMRTFLSDLTYAITGKIQDQCAVSSRLSLTLLPCSLLSLQSRPSFSKWVLKMKSRFSQCFLPANVQKKTSFFCSRNSGNTHHCQSFSQFSPNSFSSLFSLILPVTYGFTDYYYQCPLEMQNGRCQSEISNGWRERKKKE